MQALLELARTRTEAVLRDRERLQGSWQFVSGMRQADIRFTGEAFAVTFRNGAVYRGTFRLDPHHRPRAMAMLIEDGPEPHRGKTTPAIYEFDGDHLIWYPGAPGQPDWPRVFPQLDDPGHLVIIFRRDRAA